MPGEGTPGDHNAADLQERIGAAVPDRDAVVDGDRRFTWADLTDRTRRLAGVLREAGVGLRASGSAADQVEPWASPHHHVALYLYNGHEYLEGMLGAWKARAAAVNVNYRYVANELAYILRDSGARVLVVDRRFLSTTAEVLSELPDLRLVLVVDRPDRDGGDRADPAVERARATVAAAVPLVDYEEALATARPVPPGDLPPDDRYVVYTGGTTGRPKGVLWRQGDFLATCLGIDGPAGAVLADAARPERAGLRVLPSAPLMHGAAHWNALSALLGGGTVVLPHRPERLDAADVLATCARERVSSLQIVGDAFARPLLDELSTGGHDLDRLRFLLSGGAVLSQPVKRAWVDALPGLRIIDVLGSSETGRQALGDADTSGFSPGERAAVLSSDRSRRLAPGEAEEGWLAQAGRVPLGYLGHPEATRATFPVIDSQRYAVAGDRVVLEADGRVTLLGRDSAVINTGGEKVYAEEVEQALTSHSAVTDALVVGRPDPRWGQEVVAVVQLADENDDPGDTALRDHCRQTLAGYKVPKVVVRAPVVRRSPSGKPDYAWARSVVSDT